MEPLLKGKNQGKRHKKENLKYKGIKKYYTLPTKAKRKNQTKPPLKTKVHIDERTQEEAPTSCLAKASAIDTLQHMIKRDDKRGGDFLLCNVDTRNREK